MRMPWLLAWVFCLACSGAQVREPPSQGSQNGQEIRFSQLRQLTFGGENAEAYWAFSGRGLILQSRPTGVGCDRIYRMPLDSSPPPLLPVSSGAGATTCAYYFPGDTQVLYASTHLASAQCPPRPDMSQGYVWALHPGYDLFKSAPDGTAPERLTQTPGYDAEGTVCAKDGSIVFTSVRDGDLELYRMDKDGGNVRRLTHTPGYDGGAFFNADCSRIVWRASRPRPGKELEDYQALLARNLVRPSRLELYVANADGSDPVQVTYLNVASFAPFFVPGEDRVVFSANLKDPRGREFDLYAVDTNGARLEQVTFTPGFDSFPNFSPDGTLLAFSSNRATLPGKGDTNVFVTRWVKDARPVILPSGADRVMEDVRFLASPAREGRGLGTAGLKASADHLEARFRALGLAPAGDAGGFRQGFPVTVRLESGPGTKLLLGAQPVPAEGMRPLPFSASQTVTAPLVRVGFGIRAPELGHDDYARVDVKDKIVVAHRFAPRSAVFEKAENRRFSELRHKVWTARERGAKGILIVDLAHPGEAEAPLPRLSADGVSDAGLAAAIITRAALEPVLPQLKAGRPVTATLSVELKAQQEQAQNVVARLVSQAPASEKLPGVVVIGAHYDHLGMGGAASLAPGEHVPHVGADDNASGTAALLEIAHQLKQAPERLKRDVVFVAFSAEEAGVLGSTHFTRSPPSGLSLTGVQAMLNLDMVGRLRGNTLDVLGAQSAAEWETLLDKACQSARVRCSPSGGGYGPSDHTPFFAAGIPVLHFFTGVHGDYHKPSDTPERINAAGTAQIALLISELTATLSQRREPLTFRNAPAPPSHGDMKGFNASLGTIPDYAGPPKGQKGVLLAGVRPKGAADLAGLARGDLLIRLADKPVESVEDFMFILQTLKPGQTVPVTVLRAGQELKVQATLQHGRR